MSNLDLLQIPNLFTRHPNKTTASCSILQFKQNVKNSRKFLTQSQHLQFCVGNLNLST